VNVAQFGEVPAGLCNWNRGLVYPVDGLEHAGLAKETGGIIQKLKKY